MLVFHSALGDAAYDAEHNHKLCRDLGLSQSVIPINPRNYGTKEPKTSLRRTMHQCFHCPFIISDGASRAPSASTSGASDQR